MPPEIRISRANKSTDELCRELFQCFKALEGKGHRVVMTRWEPEEVIVEWV